MLMLQLVEVDIIILGFSDTNIFYAYFINRSGFIEYDDCLQ